MTSLILLDLSHLIESLADRKKETQKQKAKCDKDGADSLYNYFSGRIEEIDNVLGKLQKIVYDNRGG